MKRLTGTFMARGDDHRVYTIYEYTDFVDAGNHDDPSAEIPGLKELQTSNGAPINYKEKGVYQIMSTGVVLRTDASKRPVKTDS